MGKQRFEERVEQRLTLTSLEEGQDANGIRKVKAIGITAGVVNGNRRRYPRPVLESALGELNNHLHESAGQGRLVATGEAEHPSDKGGRPSLLETVIKWEAAGLSGDSVLLEGVILPTSKGRDILALVENGVPVGVSMRGYGRSKAVKEAGDAIQEVTELTITGFDLVAEPSDPYARLIESKQGGFEMEEQDKELLAKLEEAQRAKAELEKQQAETAKQLEEAQKAAAELAEVKRQAAIDSAIAEATKDLKYGEPINGMFVEAVRAAKPADVAAVATIVEAKRKEYDAIMAGSTLAGKGKVQVLGPVFERETGVPAYLRPSWELTESVLRANNTKRRKLDEAEDSASIFARRYLELYEKQYAAQLKAEARQFEEAEQTSDMNLPYSVMRTIVEQMWPEVIAANVYDIGIATQSPERLYFESFAGESGTLAVAVTNESVTGDHGVWVQMANKRLNPGSVVLTNSAGTTTYVEGTDYVIDYGSGKVMTLAAGATTDGQSLLIDYTYDAVRKGEMTAIERAKNTLTYKTLEIAADRLATEISREAVVFSRSQLGYDAVGRTLSNLVRQLSKKIDQDMHYLALAAALQQASNSGGTWTAASDAESVFVKYLGIAKTKVYNRYFSPTSIVMSQTNADRLSNWDGFKRDGFPNAVLTAAGFAGSVKGLPIFATPTFPDTYALVVNREVVMHRVFQAMQLRGPFASYSSNKLVASEQYYVEEFNGTDAPVVEKASYIKIA